MPYKKRIVIKIGSSLLANSELLTPRWAFIQQLLEDVSRLKASGYEVILCSSGAVALGLNMLGETAETAGLRHIFKHFNQFGPVLGWVLGVKSVDT
ncbi:MAG: hypothetical protein AAFQ85_13255, partial [Pseudomonadota bacterium]